MTANAIYSELRNSYTLHEIASNLHLHSGTLKRWENTKNVPQNYIYDLNSMLDNKYEIPKQNHKSYDEYFTKTQIAKHCYNLFLNFVKKHSVDLSNYIFIEPSCGNGTFYRLMPKNRRIGIDLEFRGDEILKRNFLDFTPSTDKNIVLGNPPFGLRGNLALRFINHAAAFSDFVAFILPPLFDSDGKGSPKKRVKGLSLVYSEKLPLNSFVYPDKKEVEVATVFQIWVNDKLLKNKTLNIDFQEKKTCKDYIKIYSLSDGGTPSSTRNKSMLNACDLYLPSTCFHSKTNPQMKVYNDFISLPNKRGYGIVILKEKEKVKAALLNIDWEAVSFLGTNSSRNLRTSLIEDALVSCGFYDRGAF